MTCKRRAATGHQSWGCMVPTKVSSISKRSGTSGKCWEEEKKKTKKIFKKIIRGGKAGVRKRKLLRNLRDGS